MKFIMRVYVPPPRLFRHTELLKIFFIIFLISQNAAICPGSFSNNVGVEW